MIWLDFFLQLFTHALAWCLAVPTAVAISILAFKVYLAIEDWLARPRFLRPGRSPFSGGLS